MWPEIRGTWLCVVKNPVIKEAHSLKFFPGITFFTDFSGVSCMRALKQSWELQLPVMVGGGSLPTPSPQLWCSLNPLLNCQLTYMGEFSTGE